MIKKIGVMMQKNNLFSLWLIGPSASGKTTVSKILHKTLSQKYNNLTLLDGDQGRKIFVRESGYDPISRSKNIKQYVSIISWISSFKISSIVAAINAFEKDRDFCRKNIKNYKEIYLKSSLETRMQRDMKKLYEPALKGFKKNVVDVDIPFESPKKADLVIDTETLTPEKIANKIIKEMKI